MINLRLKHAKMQLFGNQCTFCDTNISSSDDIPACALCLKELPWCTQPGQTLGELAAFYYEDPISQYILAGKSGKSLEKLHILGQLFNQRLTEHQQALPEALIPIPLHRKRLRKRGFNQSLELARPISQQFNIPILAHCVDRVRDTGNQKGLNETQRRQNMNNAFAIRNKIPYQHVAIFDDVITTGTTCVTLRSLLIEHGIKKVEIWCCATTKQ